MKKPTQCHINVEICEDCRHWEPIPFHDRGGECIPRVEVPVIRLLDPVPVSNPEKVLVNV